MPMTPEERESIIQETLSRIRISTEIESVATSPGGVRFFRAIVTRIMVGDTELCKDYVGLSSLASEMGD